MAIDLDDALEWSTATGDADTMLQNLQANILKGHVRDCLSVLFLRFDDATEGRTFLRSLRPLMKSAKQHLEEVRDFKAGTPQPASAVRSYVGVGLTATGYALLGETAPADPAYGQTGGMKGSRPTLHDPPVSTWDPGYQGDLHAVVLVGDDADHIGRQVATTQAVLDLVTDGVVVVAQETGVPQVNKDGHGIEHFGYVDGRSQPLFLVEDVTEETNGDGTSVWDPRFPLKQLVVEDPAFADGAHFGSYFVFRKLEQNVALFKQQEESLADALGLVGDDRERAGAMLVGRFEDGTPVTLQSDGGAHSGVLNDFDYDSDAAGAKCPFHAHIRKTNPRGSGGAPGGGPADVAFERSHLMARRGQTYGHRLDDPNGDVPPSDRPSGGVGLLFMAFNADLGAQFEFTQAAWADNDGFPFTAPTPSGRDPVIGQGPRPEVAFPATWGKPRVVGGVDQNMVTTATAAQAVTMKGGQYFFMPSLEFLAGL